MHQITCRHFHRALLALAAGAALAPRGSQALDLAQSPPGTKEPYVAPNVILSLDDSYSMIGTVTGSSQSRSALLKAALIEVFSDTTLLPDGKIRLAWQTMNAGSEYYDWNLHCSVPLTVDDAAAATATKPNLLRILEGTPGAAGSRDTSTSRGRFLYCMDHFEQPGSTPTHRLLWSANQYMRAALNPNGPWASVPGAKGRPYLACRRNYHILMTDGGWNAGFANVPPEIGTANPANYDGNSRTLPDGVRYNDTFDTTAYAQTQIYRDSEPAGSSPASFTIPATPYIASATPENVSTIADWALYSWSQPLQNAGDLDQRQSNGSALPLTKDYLTAPSSETFINRVTKTKAILGKYWNPRYDPATWPHMQTFTIGFSTEAIPPGNFGAAGTTPLTQVTSPTSVVPYGYDGNFADYANGTYPWRVVGGLDQTQRGLDMWHAAINGRGQFYSVTQASDLKTAFRNIIGKIITENEPGRSPSAASGFNNTRNDVGSFFGSYEPDNAWKGYVRAQTVKKDGSVVPTTTWAGETTADKLDALPDNAAGRLILTWSDSWNGSQFKGGVPFRWNSNGTANLSTAQNALLGLSPGTAGITVGTDGQNILNYVRGDRTLEGSKAAGYTAALPFRQRSSRQGDIVNSTIWYTGVPSSNYTLPGYLQFVRDQASRAAVLYVGGNDGMLHGFSSVDGSERIAYVPRGVVSTLKLLTDPIFDEQHRYFVDGSPMTGDIVDSGVWKTILVGTLGAGGKGYFVIDVTKPDGFAEANAHSLVKLDRTRGAVEAAPDCAAMADTGERAACQTALEEDRDIGQIAAQPVLDETNPLRTTQIARMNDDRWAVVMGNGYNSANQRPVLLIQYLDGADRKLVRIPATSDAAGSGNATDNGLSAPRVVDLDGDGRVDVVYAGDNLGNLWKFDLTSADPTNWTTAFKDAAGVARPLFTARGPSTQNATTRAKVQAITAVPTVRANDRAMTVTTANGTQTVAKHGIMVAFGTGRNVTASDASSDQIQSLYSVLDNTHYKFSGLGTNRRLQVDPGDPSCLPTAINCVPAPRPLGVMGGAGLQLAEQVVAELSGDAYAATVAPKNNANRLTSSNWANFDGWFLDLPVAGERLLKPMGFYDGSNILAVYTQVPARGSLADTVEESCLTAPIGAERQFFTLVNIMDGLRPSIQIIDMNADGAFDGADLAASRDEVSKGSHTQVAGRGKILDVEANKIRARMPEQSLRPSWRQLR